METRFFLISTMIDNFKEKFPSITEICLENGINLEEGLIPVVPGSHFLMGGIKVNLNGRQIFRDSMRLEKLLALVFMEPTVWQAILLLEGLSFGKRLAEFINSYEPNQMQAIQNS